MGNKIFTVENFKYVPTGVTWVADEARGKLERALLNGKDTGISRNTGKEGVFWYTANKVKDYIPDGCRLPTYDDIVACTGASTATISRVKRCLHYGADGYKVVLERLQQKKEGSEAQDADKG